MFLSTSLASGTNFKRLLEKRFSVNVPTGMKKSDRCGKVPYCRAVNSILNVSTGTKKWPLSGRGLPSVCYAVVNVSS